MIVPSMEELIERCRGLVEEHGLYVQHVGSGDGSPGFTYSVGLQKNTGHPEIVMVGFDPNLCQQLINDTAAKIRAGERFDRPCLAGDIITNFDVGFRPLTPESVESNTGMGQRVIGSTLEAVQMYLPDPNGLFPWDDGCDPRYAEMQQGPFEPEGMTPGVLPSPSRA